MGDKCDLNAGIRAVAHQSAGALNLVVVRVHELPALARQAKSGERFASLVFRAATDLRSSIANAGADRRMQCGGCLCAVLPGNDDYAIIVAVPSGVDATDLLAFAMCRICGLDHATALRKSVDVLRSIWPDARGVRLHSEAGNA